MIDQLVIQLRNLATMERKITVVLCVMVTVMAAAAFDVHDPMVCNDMHLHEFRNIDEVTR